jgi:hypothetical protein
MQKFNQEIGSTHTDHGGSPHTVQPFDLLHYSLQYIRSTDYSRQRLPLTIILRYARPVSARPNRSGAMVSVALSVLCVLICYLQGVDSLVLLSDLSTPAFLVDVQVLQQHLDSVSKTANTPIPPMDMFGRNKKLVPFPIMDNLNDDSCPHNLDENAAPVLDVLDTPGLCYLHASVVTPREGASTPANQNPAFLATLDLLPNIAAELVLGLNNHHVGSYYWARAAGAGAWMEAPGVLFDASTATLQWQSEQGAIGCNSNDGKRSEWVNFLRPGDQVQLRPLQLEAQDVLTKYGANANDSPRIFGVSSKSRPMGSEPAVVCEWRIEEGL